MSNRRMMFDPSGIFDHQELRVLSSQESREIGAVPTERHIASAVAAMPDEWFEAFLVELDKRSPNRAFSVAHVGAQLDPELTEIGGFGMSPKDSQALLDLRVAIDTHLGWSDHAAEQTADYVVRIKEVGETLGLASIPMSEEARRSLDRGIEDAKAGRVAPFTLPGRTLEALVEELDKIDHVLETFGFDSTRPVREMQGAFERLRKLEIERGDLSDQAALVPGLIDKVTRLRAELRRFNAEARLRSRTLALAQHQHAVYVDPEAELLRIAGLVRVLRELFQRTTPDNFTERSASAFVEMLCSWEEHLKQ